MEVNFLVGVAAQGVWASVTLQPTDRTVVRAFSRPRGTAVLVCAVVLSYLSTVVSLQKRLGLLRMSHRTGFVFSFSNEKLRCFSCGPCEIAVIRISYSRHSASPPAVELFINILKSHCM